MCLWNRESWALKSAAQLKESGIHGVRNPVTGIRNPQGGIQNPRLSLITLHGVSELSAKIVFYGKHPAPITRDRWEPETS